MFEQAPFYEIKPDTDRALIHVRMVGLWSVALVDRYMVELEAAVADMARRHAGFGIVVDARTCPVQLAETSTRFAEATAHWPAPGTGPIKGLAIVVGSILNKLQAERTFGSLVRVFRELCVAQDWVEARIAGAAMEARHDGRTASLTGSREPAMTAQAARR